MYKFMQFSLVNNFIFFPSAIVQGPVAEASPESMHPPGDQVFSGAAALGVAHARCKRSFEQIGWFCRIILPVICLPELCHLFTPSVF